MRTPTPQDLLREYAQLNRRRRDTGITPLELLRWNDLRSQLAHAFPGRPAPPGGGRTRVLVEFETPVDLRQAIMANLKPIGLFVPTPFAAETGTRFDLRVIVKQTGEQFDGPVVVISNNVGPDFSTRNLGMGVRFDSPDCALREALTALY